MESEKDIYLNLFKNWLLLILFLLNLIINYIFRILVSFFVLGPEKVLSLFLLICFILTSFYFLKETFVSIPKKTYRA